MESIKCTVNGCSCICFSPARSQLRICNSCQHGWVAHAMDKIGQQQRSSSHDIPTMTLPSSAIHSRSGPLSTSSSTSVDPSQANCLFDVASLILFGAEAIPTRLKILLDRLFVRLQRDLVLQVLASFGWAYDDYCRGYRIQDGSGQVLDKWTMASVEEELVILNQFQRFTETKSIAEEWLQSTAGQRRGGKSSSLHSHESSSSSSPRDVKQQQQQQLLNGTVSRAPSDIEASRHLFSSGAAYLSSLLPRYPSLYNPFMTGPTGISGSSAIHVGQLSQASVLPYLLARSPLRPLQKPIDFRIDSAECLKSSSRPPGIVHGSPAKRNGKMSEGREEGRMVKMEATDDRISCSATETNIIQAMTTDEDEPIDYSRKEDRFVPDLSKNHSPSSTSSSASSSSSSSTSNPRNPSTEHSPGENQSPNGFPDQDQKHQPPRKTSSSTSSSSSSVVKKPYQPTPGYGGTLISPNGKKRVLCTACLKTFCDKGALKIHYSAVHLKELHMCTIDGCTMTFSSRRSRNRHSANPNPKLHFGQTGRRRLHNNHTGSRSQGSNGPDSSPFREEDEEEEGQETTMTSDPGSPRSDGGEFQLCRSSLDRGCDEGPADQQRSMAGQEQEEDEDDDGDCGSRFHQTEEDGGLNEDGLEEEERRLEEKAEEHHPRFLHGGTSKRKSAMPTRCSIAPMEDSVTDFHGNDSLESAERKRRRLINDNDNPDDSEEKESNGKGRSSVEEVENDVTAQEELGDEEKKKKIESLMDDAVDEADIVDLSLIKRSPSSQSSVTNVEDNEAMMRDAKGFLSERPSVDRDSACGCCDTDSESKDLEGFQRTFEAGPVDGSGDLQGRGGQRSNHACKVEGCGASFPSKRSRDRHSANTNLHRRLFYSSDQQGATLRKEEETEEEIPPPALLVSLAPVDERKKWLDTALNLTTNITDDDHNQMGPNDDIPHQPETFDSKVEVERVNASTDLLLTETQISSIDEFPDSESSTMTTDHQMDRNSHSSETFHRSAAKNFSKVRKNRNLLSINENLHNHLLVNSSPASAQLAI